MRHGARGIGLVVGCGLVWYADLIEMSCLILLQSILLPRAVDGVHPRSGA